jgi:5-methyltetrahydropteroyltriglutamate--homocysteine methyltransferase
MTTTTVKPPFRADQVGSLIRPERLIAARDKVKNGTMDRAALTAIQDDCIREVVRLQEEAGLPAITDGEYRRRVWYADFLCGFDNVREAGMMLDVAVTGADGAITHSKLQGMRVDGKLRRSHPIQVPSFEFLKPLTKRTIKVCIPSPSMMHFRGGRDAVDRAAYPDMEIFWADLTAAYRAEVEDLLAHGLTYLQFDDTNLAYLCDDNFRAAVAQLGEDPNALPLKYCEVINDVVRGLRDKATFTIHLCRGNARASGVAAGGVARGGYEPVAEVLFGSLDVDGYFLEYDDERSGDFRPLRHVPRGKRVVVGLVSTKKRDLEPKDLLKRRLDEAAKVLPMEQLCLSPQCGFSSGVGRKALDIDDEKRKLALVVETAMDVWGGL